MTYNIWFVKITIAHLMSVLDHNLHKCKHSVSPAIIKSSALAPSGTYSGLGKYWYNENDLRWGWGTTRKWSMRWITNQVMGFEYYPGHSGWLSKGFKYENYMVLFEFWKCSLFIHLISSVSGVVIVSRNAMVSNTRNSLTFYMSWSLKSINEINDVQKQTVSAQMR